MLIIPTSLDTAVLLEIGQPLILTAPVFVSLVVGAYCLWELLLSRITGRGAPVSRWGWLIAAGVLLGAAVGSSATMFGEVTFNADGPDWVSTTWGGVLGVFFMAAYCVCVLIVVVLRGTDAARADRSARLRGVMLWLIGLCVALAYGILLAVNADMPYGSALGTPVRASGFVLTMGGIGSLLAAAAIRRMRPGRASEVEVRSV